MKTNKGSVSQFIGSCAALLPRAWAVLILAATSVLSICAFAVFGARAEPAMVMLRFSSAQTQSMEEWRQTAKAFAANRGCCDDVWFSTGESFPGLDWHRKNVEVIRVAAEDLRKLGIRVSLQFEATIGHGDNFPTAEEKARFDKPWTGWTGPDGTSRNGRSAGWTGGKTARAAIRASKG